MIYGYVRVSTREQGKLSARGAAKELSVSHNTFLKWASMKIVEKKVHFFYQIKKP
ncbi:MAG: hypothetical protein J6K89_03540 [Oscillospiraceae bacterium]|nr:hypothetical protein [Oscillospiraceae bacterium]